MFYTVRLLRNTDLQVEEAGVNYTVDFLSWLKYEVFCL